MIAFRGLSVAILATCTLLDAAEIPKDAAELIDKFETWETAERAEVEERIAEQRAELVERLRIQLEKIVKGGDLETANALKDRIDQLASEEVRAPSEMTFRLPWDDGPGTVRITFHSNGTASQVIESTGRSFPRQFRWEITAPRVVEFWWHQSEKGSLMRWAFSPDHTTARVRNRKSDKTFDASRVVK